MNSTQLCVFSLSPDLKTLAKFALHQQGMGLGVRDGGDEIELVRGT